MSLLIFIISDSDRNGFLLLVLIGIVLWQGRKDLLKRVQSSLKSHSDYSVNLRLKGILFERTPYAVMATDPHGKILMWNRRAEKKLGYSQEEVLGKNISIIIPEEFKAMHAAGMQRWRETGQSRIIDNEDGIELMALHKDGHQFPVHLKLVSINDEGFKTIGGFIRNIQKEKDREADVMGRLVMLERTEMLADVGGWHWDTLTDKVKVTSNFRRLYNVDDDEEITAKMLMDLVYPDDQMEVGMVIVRAREAKESYVVNYRRLQPDGKLALIECRGFVILDEEGEEKGIEGTIRKYDYTDGQQFLGES